MAFLYFTPPAGSLSPTTEGLQAKASPTTIHFLRLISLPSEILKYIGLDLMHPDLDQITSSN